MKKIKLRHSLIIIVICFIILIISISFSGLLNSIRSNYPEVTASIELRDVTEEEYDANSLAEYSIQNLKILYADIRVKNSKHCKKRDIQIPELNVIDGFDRVRSIKGGSSETNNLYKDNNAQAIKFVIFDSTGLTINDIKRIYQDEFIAVNITTRKGKDISRSYNVGEMIKVRQ